jgi:D-hexose-6-phosphate mutarotase
VVLSDVEVPIVEAPVKKAAAVVQGANDAGLKTITLTNQATGDSATMFTFGACVTSYIAGGVETLKVRPDAKLDGSKPISGGIPHCFPQFGPGAIQQHGKRGGRRHRLGGARRGGFGFGRVRSIAIGHSIPRDRTPCC